MCGCCDVTKEMPATGEAQGDGQVVYTFAVTPQQIHSGNIGERSTSSSLSRSGTTSSGCSSQEVVTKRKYRFINRLPAVEKLRERIRIKNNVLRRDAVDWVTNENAAGRMCK